MTTCSLKTIPSDGHWCSNWEQEAGRSGCQSSAETQELVQQAAGLISARPSGSTTLSSKDQMAAPSRRCASPHPSPAGVKMQAPPSPAAAWNGPPAACGLGARAPCGSCVPDSSEPPWPWEAPTHESLLTTPGHGRLVSAGREGLPKQGCSGLGSRAAKRKLQGWVTTAQPNLCPQPHPLTAHSAKGSAIPGGAHQSATGRKEGNGIPQCSAALGPRP